MKLLRKTLGLYLLVALPIFLISLGGFFYILRNVITKQVDESLQQNKREIEDFVNNNKNDVTKLYKNISCSYYLKEIPSDSAIDDNYRFISVYDSTLQEYQPVRELRSTIQIRGKNYEIVLLEPFVERDTLILSIGSFAVFFFVLLTLGISIIQWIVSRKIWKPFRKSLNKISEFSPGTSDLPTFEKTSIKEFTQLNETLDSLVQRINSDFEKQKRFIDNISHELQTPISVISAQLELLIQEIELKDTSAAIIDIMDENLVRMKRANQSLLLLSKIQNNQFLTKQEVNLNNQIHKFIAGRQDQLSLKGIMVNNTFGDQLTVYMNPDLADILINNLLTNAIIHNHQDGRITIEIQGSTLMISNTGNELNIDPSELFNKYIRSGNSKISTGLGLSIVKEICNHYRYNVSYTYSDHTHKLEIQFK